MGYNEWPGRLAIALLFSANVNSSYPLRSIFQFSIFVSVAFVIRDYLSSLPFVRFYFTKVILFFSSPLLHQLFLKCGSKF